MSSLSRALVFSMIGAAAPLAALDTSLAVLVPSDAKVVAGLDFDRVKDSVLGQLFLGQLPASGLQRFGEAAGFELRRDLREIVIFSTAVNDRPSIALLRGAFDEGRIRGLAAAAGGRLIEHRGVTLLAGGSPGPRASGIAFLGSGLVAAGDVDAIKATIDRSREPGRTDPTLAARMQEASTRFDLWILSPGSPAGLARGMPNPNLGGAMNGDLMQALENAVAGFRFGSNVEVGAEATARSEKDALALVDVIKFFSSMVQSNGDARAGALLDSMQVSSEGRTVRMSLSIPQQQFEQLLGTRRSRGRI